MITLQRSVLFATLLLTGLSCGEDKKVGPGPDKKGPLIVYTVNEPLRYFAERIGGKAVKVVFPMKEDGDPAFWTPSTETVLAYQGADLIVRNGAGYAKWMDKVSIPSSKVVDSSSAFADQLIQVDSSVTHQHGPTGKHSHSGYAFTIWLDPELALQQALALKDALSARLPELDSEFEEGLASLRHDLDALHGDLHGIVTKKPGLPLLGSHPVYQYLRKRYDLDLVSLHWEPDQMPGESQWAEMAQIRKKHGAAHMLWEAEPTAEIRSKLTKLGIQCVVYDPCATTPSKGDWLTRMRQNIENLRAAYR